MLTHGMTHAEAAASEWAAAQKSPALRAARERWQNLTQDERDLIHDALSDAEAVAREDAINWRGRKREARYLREADELFTLRLKLFPDPIPQPGPEPQEML